MERLARAERTTLNVTFQCERRRAKFGRPRKVYDFEHIATAKRIKAHDHTGKNIAKHRGVSSAMIYRHLSEDGSA